MALSVKSLIQDNVHMGDVKGAFRGLFTNIKTTPFKLGGGYHFINAGSKTMAVRADKVNEKLIRQEKVNIVAQISGDAKAGSYYGIYAVRTEAIEEVLKFFKGRNYFVLLGNSDSDYIYMSVYWGHMTYLWDRADLFCKFLARYLSETAMFLGSKRLEIPQGTLSAGGFLRKLHEAVTNLAKHTYGYKKKWVDYKDTVKNIWAKVRRMEVTSMINILKGGPTLYIPDDACMDGLMKMSKDHEALKTANDALGALTRLELVTGLNKVFNIYKTSAADIFTDFDDYIKKVMADYSKKISDDAESEVLQMVREAKGGLGPGLDAIASRILSNRLHA